MYHSGNLPKILNAALSFEEFLYENERNSRGTHFLARLYVSPVRLAKRTLVGNAIYWRLENV